MENNLGQEAFESRKDWEDFIWEEFAQTLLGLNSKKQITGLLNSVISKKEKNFIIKRLIAIQLINQGKSYSEISRILWISPNTISSIKKCLNNQTVYQSKKIKGENIKNKRTKRFDESAEEILRYWKKFPFPAKIGKGRWKFLNYQG